MGDNVANALKTQEVAQKEGGGDEILQTLLVQAQNGELKDEKTLQILQKYQTMYAQQQGQQLAIA